MKAQVCVMCKLSHPPKGRLVCSGCLDSACSLIRSATARLCSICGNPSNEVTCSEECNKALVMEDATVR